MSDALHVDAHAAGAAGNRANCRIHIGRRQIGILRLGDFFELGAGHLADFFRVRRAAALFTPAAFFSKDRCGRGLLNERKTAIAV